MAKNNTNTQKKTSSPNITVKNKTMYTSEKIISALSSYMQQEYSNTFIKALYDLENDPNIDKEVLIRVKDVMTDYVENYANKRMSSWVLGELSEFNEPNHGKDEQDETSSTTINEESKSSNTERIIGFAAN